MVKVAALNPEQVGRLKESMETVSRAKRGSGCRTGKPCGGTCISRSKTCGGKLKTKKPTEVKPKAKPILNTVEPKNDSKMGKRLSPAKLKSVLGDTLHVSDINTKTVKLHLEDLRLLPEGLLNHAKGKGVSIHLGDVTMPSLNSNQEYKGVRPRGWAEKDTWDKVPGAYNAKAKSVSAGAGRHGSVSPALHEFFHGIGHVAEFDDHPKMLAIHKKIYSKLPPYLQQGGPGGSAGSQELFAEGAAHLLKDRNKAISLYGAAFAKFIDTEVLTLK